MRFSASNGLVSAFLCATTTRFPDGKFARASYDNRRQKPNNIQDTEVSSFSVWVLPCAMLRILKHSQAKIMPEDNLRNKHGFTFQPLADFQRLNDNIVDALKT